MLIKVRAVRRSEILVWQAIVDLLNESKILVWQALVNPSNIGVAAAIPATLVPTALLDISNGFCSGYKLRWSIHTHILGETNR